MEDEILSIIPNRNTTTDPYVIRLPDGHVRVTATSIVFPETCPRCGSSPANTKVRLHLTKGGSEHKPSIKLPFCQRCGLMLNITQYLFAAILVVIMLFVIPHLSRFSLFSRWHSSVAFIASLWIISWVLDQVFKLFYKPGVEVVVAKEDCFELVFDDQMYAEKFVELNR